MATAQKTEVQTPAVKAPKVKRTPQPLSARVSDQLTKAVLSKKITKDELAKRTRRMDAMGILSRYRL